MSQPRRLQTRRPPSVETSARKRGELPVGAHVQARGVLWRVRAYRNDAAILAPLDEDGAFGGPPRLIPDPLGDTPLIVEVMSKL